MKSQIEEFERRINYKEDYNRRNNLRFTGIQEQPGGESWEETAQIVTKLLEDKLQVPTMKLERAHRTGQANPSRQRTIVARFEKSERLNDLTASNEPTGRVGGDVTVSGGAGGRWPVGSGAKVGGGRDVSSAAPVGADVWAAAGAAAVSPAVAGVDAVAMSPGGAGAGAAASSLRGSSDGTPTHVGSLGGSAGDLRVGSGVVQRQPMNLRNRKK
ncbi:hypothetical protein Pcinc_000507 [Petrolisthes cinctipes]|uniref:Uncharacterized protein n=1 Tax=Petrolisthes cinctipes TaxID=88211 RepID=A0AAE1GMM1_PETCI|nr:hypothetical protein Pcinc_000507 [Petrolisthes cinctipes]